MLLVFVKEKISRGDLGIEEVVGCVEYFDDRRIRTAHGPIGGIEENEAEDEGEEWAEEKKRWSAHDDEDDDRRLQCTLSVSGQTRSRDVVSDMSIRERAEKHECDRPGVGNAEWQRDRFFLDVLPRE